VKRFLAILIPVALLTIFVLVMVSASYLKKPFGQDDNVPAIIEEIKTDVRSGDWSGAEDGADRLEKAWDIITKRVQFSAERDQLRDARTSIARLKGCIEAADSAGSLAELGEVKEHWTDIGQ